MGQQYSAVEFRAVLHALKFDDASPLLGDHSFWFPLFLTELGASEVFSFVGANDIRFLRRYRPHHLVLLVRKCIEQLQTFLGRPREVADHCSVINALRILTAILPYVFEPLEVVPHPMRISELFDLTIPLERREQYSILMSKLSPFAEHFAWHCFFRNAACRFVSPCNLPLDGSNADKEQPPRCDTEDRSVSNEQIFLTDASEASSCSRHQRQEEFYPPLQQYSGSRNTGASEVSNESSVPIKCTDKGKEQPMPLARTLLHVLLQLCHSPAFTISRRRTSVEDSEGNATEEDAMRGTAIISLNPPIVSTVHADALWYGGPIVGSASSSLSSSTTMEGHREDVLRCLLACCAGPIMSGRTGVDLAAEVEQLASCRHSTLDGYWRADDLACHFSNAQWAHWLASSSELEPHSSTLATSILHLLLQPLPMSSSAQRLLALAIQFFIVVRDDSAFPTIDFSLVQAINAVNDGVLGQALQEFCSPSRNVFHSIVADVLDHPAKRHQLLTALTRFVASPWWASEQSGWWPVGSRIPTHLHFESLLFLTSCFASFDRPVTPAPFPGNKTLAGGSKKAKTVTFNSFEIFQEALFASLEKAGPFLLALLFFICEAASNLSGFFEAELAVLFLLRISGSPSGVFIETLGHSMGTPRIPIALLRNIEIGNKGCLPTFGDALLLTMCFVLSDSAPIYFFSLIDQCAAILGNVAALFHRQPLKEVVAFELFNSFRFLSDPKLLIKGDVAQRAALHVAEAVLCWTKEPSSVDGAPLRFLLGATPVAADLADIVRKRFVVVEAAWARTEQHGDCKQEVKLSEWYVQMVPAERLCAIASECRVALSAETMAALDEALRDNNEVDLRDLYRKEQERVRTSDGRRKETGGKFLRGGKNAIFQEATPLDADCASEPHIAVRRLRHSGELDRYLYTLLWWVVHKGAAHPLLPIESSSSLRQLLRVQLSEMEL